LIDKIVEDITTLYENVSFSTVTFNKHIVENVTHLPRLLEIYYLVSSQLDNILALSLESILSSVPNLDHCICELLSVEEEIGEGGLLFKTIKYVHSLTPPPFLNIAYIASMQEDMLKDFFEKDGRQFVNWK
jgi:hypothetical protein